MNAAHEALAVYGVDLGEAVDNTALAWVPAGKGWFGQTPTSYSGGDAAQSATSPTTKKPCFDDGDRSGRSGCIGSSRNTQIILLYLRRVDRILRLPGT